MTMLDQATTLAPQALDALRSSDERLVVIGASGWIGQNLLCALHKAMGGEDFAERVVCFGSSDRRLSMPGGRQIDQLALEQLGSLDRRSTTVFHLAFLTKDKVAGMPADDYTAANRALREAVLGALDPIGARRVFVASSGAAAFADDPDAAADLRLYGQLKQEDERAFAAWADESADGRTAVIARIFSLSGPFINKHETYALASFILNAMAGRPIEVKATVPVYRSYVAIRELLSLVMCQLFSARQGGVVFYDTGGEPVEIGELADAVANEFGVEVLRASMRSAPANRYVGSGADYGVRLAAFGLEHVALAQQIRETACTLGDSQP